LPAGLQVFSGRFLWKIRLPRLEQVPEVIELVAQLRVRYRLKIAVVRNEAQ
jgi:hypothetical protein